VLYKIFFGGNDVMSKFAVFVIRVRNQEVSKAILVLFKFALIPTTFLYDEA
jgi:hypothetical protein